MSPSQRRQIELNRGIVTRFILVSAPRMDGDSPPLVNVFRSRNVAEQLIAFRHSMERRRAVRYRLGAAAIFGWEGPEHIPLKGEGITRDLGRGGVFVFSAICPAVNSFVRIRVLLHLINWSTPDTEARMPDIELTERSFALSTSCRVLHLAGLRWPRPESA